MQGGNRSHCYLPAMTLRWFPEPPSLGRWSRLVINDGDMKENHAFANASWMIDRKTEKRLEQRHETQHFPNPLTHRKKLKSSAATQMTGKFNHKHVFCSQSWIWPVSVGLERINQKKPPTKTTFSCHRWNCPLSNNSREIQPEFF